MKKQLHISTSFDQPRLLETLVEKLAYRRYDIGFSKERMPGSHKGLETSSTETFVSGTNAVDEDNERFNIPFITRFLFTCVKAHGHDYKLTWAACMN